MSDGNGKRKWSSEIDPVLVDPTGNMHKGITMPGWDGIPFRGPIPDLKENDSKQPAQHQKVHVEVLELWKPKDMARYREVCQVVANGYGLISKEDMRYDEDKKSWRVFVRWLELFTTMEKGTVNGRDR
jgi:hypothetical protein